MTRNVVLKAEAVTKEVNSPEGRLTIVNDVSLEVAAGETAALVGVSGAGKSTLLAVLAGLDVPTSGKVWLAGEEITGLDEDARAKLRADRVGFVFQAFHLVPSLTALENVMLRWSWHRTATRGRVPWKCSSAWGLAERAGHYPRQLSGGEQQRVALARASVTRPAVLFATSPRAISTRSPVNAWRACSFELNAESHTTLLLVTHDRALAGRCGRIFSMEGGRLV